MYNQIISKAAQRIGYTLPKVEFKQGNDFSVEFNGKLATVCCKYKSDAARACLVLKSKGNKPFKYSEPRNYEHICYMADVSRNGVINVKTVKELILDCAMLGYNSFMLYTEDTYEVKNEPYFGYFRGRYTAEELKELNAYANELGIELIPCIQTLAHLNAISRYAEYYPHFDFDDILLIGDERVYTLIDNMFSSLSEYFTSRYVHIGMDEAHMIGLGKYLDKNGYQNRFDLLSRHLTRVIQIAEKYGFKPVMWGDMFENLARKLYKAAPGTPLEYPREKLGDLPQNIRLCYWDYYRTDVNWYNNRFAFYNGMEREVWFAGGAWRWTGFLPANEFSLVATNAALQAVRKNGVKHIITTGWGDDGTECSWFANLPALANFSLSAIGVSTQDINAQFKALTEYEFDEFMKIEKPNHAGDYSFPDVSNPTKFTLYNDILCGIFDPLVKEGWGDFMKSAAMELYKLSERKSNYAYVFKTAAQLAKTAGGKCELGIKIRAAYRAGDKKALKALCSDLLNTEHEVREFLKVYRSQWFIEQKPYGFEIQEYRLGGLAERISSCRNRIADYADGKIPQINELETELLPEPYAVNAGLSQNRVNGFVRISTVNVYTHCL